MEKKSLFYEEKSLVGLIPGLLSMFRLIEFDCTFKDQMDELLKAKAD
jgi:hypothetical protein